MDDTHTYTNTAVNVIFIKMQSSRGFKLFGERAVAEMVKELKQLNKGAMPVNNFIAEINPYLLSSYDKKRLWMR